MLAIQTKARVSLLFLYTKERVSSLHGEENVILLFVEVADSRGIQEWRLGI